MFSVFVFWFDCSCFISCLIVSFDFIQERNFETGFLLAALRKNHCLEWQPNFQTKQLKRVYEKAWAKGLPANSHRIPADWVLSRHSWVDSENKTFLPAWLEETEHAEALAALKASSYEAAMGQQNPLCLEFDDGDENASEVLCIQNLELQKEIAKRKGYADPKSILSAIRSLCKKDSAKQVEKKN